MSIRLTNELFRSARTVVRTGQIKRSLDVKVHADGSVTALDESVLDILPLGNQGDNCVTEINFNLPTELQDGYFGYLVVDLQQSIYIQKCEMLNGVANAWVEEEITFAPNKELNILFVAIEEDVDAGDNITEETEIFVTDEFYGMVQDNFLTSGWHTGLVAGDDVISGEHNVIDGTPAQPQPTSYTPMTWVDGETRLNAANMNNIMLGIDEAKSASSDVLHATANDWNITGGKTFKGEVYFDAQSTARVYTTPNDDADIVSKKYVDDADKKGPLPYYDNVGNVQILTFLTNNSLLSKAFIFHSGITGWTYMAFFYSDAGQHSFEIKELRSAQRYAGERVDLTNKTFTDILTNTYKQNDESSNWFTPNEKTTVTMQHFYKQGDLIFGHIVFNRTAAESSTGIYTIGALSKYPQHQHMFVGACYNGTAANSDVCIIDTDGTVKVRFTGTTSASTYKWDLCFFFAENN